MFDHFFTVEGLLRMSLELSLGISIKLFCDNGRIHPRDFVNTFLFWVPGVHELPDHGLAREVADLVSATQPGADDHHLPLAAK